MNSPPLTLGDLSPPQPETARERDFDEILFECPTSDFGLPILN